jgi:hypothetical protein
MTRKTLSFAALAVVALGAASAPTTAGAQAPPPPVAGASVNVAAVKGTVLVQCPGEPAFAPLTAPRQIPLGCDVDTRAGTVSLTSARRSGAIQSGEFWDGLFRVSQVGDFAVLTLGGALDCSGRRSDGAGTAANRGLGRVTWGKGKGRFRVVGRRGSASTRGTTWSTTDSCHNSTAIKVTVGVVDVRDFAKNKTVAVRAGETYEAGDRGDGKCKFRASPVSRPELYVQRTSVVTCDEAFAVIKKYGTRPGGYPLGKGRRFKLGSYGCVFTENRSGEGSEAWLARCVSGRKVFLVTVES